MLSIAIQCGEHLLKNAIQLNDYHIGWSNTNGDGSVLTGMAHGNAGIAWALTKLYEETHIVPLRDYAIQAFAYEREMCSPEENNWFDLRHRQHRMQQNFPEPVNWCHSAPSIGMARVKIYNIIAEQKTGIEIERAIEKTLQEGLGGSDCLCHGAMGNIDLLLLANI